MPTYLAVRQNLPPELIVIDLTAPAALQQIQTLHDKYPQTEILVFGPSRDQAGLDFGQLGVHAGHPLPDDALLGIDVQNVLLFLFPHYYNAINSQ